MRDVLADTESDSVRRLVARKPGILAIHLRPGRRWQRRRAPFVDESRREPFLEALRNLIEEPRRQTVARLAVQHPRVRIRQVQARARACDRDIREPALFFYSVAFGNALLMREQSF